MYDNKYIKGIDIMVMNLNRTAEFVSSAAYDGIKKVGKIIDSAIKKNIRLTDHSLRDLAAMGHPYARQRPQMIHSPEYLVHKQSGDLLSSFYSDDIENYSGKSVAHVAGVNEAVAPHARYVVMGTSKMVPRNFLGGTLQEKREIIRREFILHMGSKRTWAGLKFKSK